MSEGPLGRHARGRVVYLDPRAVPIYIPERGSRLGGDADRFFAALVAASGRADHDDDRTITADDDGAIYVTSGGVTRTYRQYDGSFRRCIPAERLRAVDTRRYLRRGWVDRLRRGGLSRFIGHQRGELGRLWRWG
jgi:hypothetical protein